MPVKLNSAKRCPLVAAVKPHENGACLGESCACYVKLDNPLEPCDARPVYRYYGCGLVSSIPWELVKPEEKPQKSLE